MSEIRTDYTFDASAKTITFAGAVIFERIATISNVTAGGVLIYNYAFETGSLSGLVLTLDHDTSAMSDSDKLAIYYSDTALDVTAASLPLPSGASTETTLASVKTAVETLSATVAAAKVNVDDADTQTALASIATKLDTLHSDLGALGGYTDGLESLLTAMNGYVDGLETLLGTGNTTTASIAGFVDQLEGYVDGLETLATSTNTKLDTLHTDITGTLTVGLPSGAATSAKQDTIIGHVDGIEAALAGTLTVDGSGHTQPVSDGGGTISVDDGGGSLTVDASSLPLPTGASTGAKQDTANTSLASIDTKLPASPAAEHTTAGSPSSARLSDGAAFYKATTPSDTQPISAAALPLPSGASTSAKQPALGTAGTPSVDVVTIQGITSATAVKVDGSAVTQPVSGPASAALALDSHLTDGTNKVAAGMRTDAVVNGTTDLTPKFAPIAASSSGDNTIVALVSSKKIRVLSLVIMANGTVNGKFKSGTAGADLTGLFYLLANVGFVLPYNPLGWFESASGVLLNLNLSAAIAVGGCLVYVEV